jgi:hypothetical protein
MNALQDATHIMTLWYAFIPAILKKNLSIRYPTITWKLTEQVLRTSLPTWTLKLIKENHGRDLEIFRITCLFTIQRFRAMCMQGKTQHT